MDYGQLNMGLIICNKTYGVCYILQPISTPNPPFHIWNVLHLCSWHDNYVTSVGSLNGRNSGIKERIKKMLFSAFVAILLGFTSAKSPRSNLGCKKQLAEIVYDPFNYWSDYLRKISYNLKDIAGSYDQTMGVSRILNFQNKYQVTVTITEPVGMMISYDGVSTVDDLVRVPKNFFNHNDARVALNLGAYDQSSTHYIYSFLSYDCNAELVQVNIFRPIQDLPQNQESFDY